MISQNYHSLNSPIFYRLGEVRPPFLVELSPKDSKWDLFRRKADRIADLYFSGGRPDYAARIRQCAARLVMDLVINADGEIGLRLNSGHFCRVPRCPICGWRNSMKWEAKIFNLMPKILEQYPGHRFLFLTLTIRTCPLDELRVNLQLMNRAWVRLTQRKQFPAIGWIKKVEVTRSPNDYAHPHLHCLLMVKPSYFTGKYYLKQEAWADLWAKSMRIDYTPSTHIRRADGNKPGEIDTKAILEISKYCTKTEDIIDFNTTYPTKNAEWLVTLTQQLHKMRMLSSGGVFKDYLQDLESEYQDLIHIDDESPDNEINLKADRIVFDWIANVKRYRQSLDNLDL